MTVALEERAVPFRVVGAAAFFQRAEVRDVLAWLRLLVDPSDAGAAVRALARPPVELRAADLARCIQIARRRKLDMVSALVAATESPQLPPEARERILAFLKLHRQAAGALDTTRPDLFVHRLIERLGLRRQQLFAANADVVERLRNLARLGELAAAYVRRAPQAHAARVRALDRRGRRGRAARGGGRRARRRAASPSLTMRAAKGLRVRPRLRARPALGAHARRARATPTSRCPTRCCTSALPPDSRAAHVAEMRRLLHVAMTRARRGLVLAYAEHVRPRRAAAAVAVRRGGARGARARSGRSATSSSSAPTRRCTRRSARCATSCSRSCRASARAWASCASTPTSTSPTRSVRYLELVKLAALLERPAGQSVADALPERQRAAARGGDRAAARHPRDARALDDALLEAERDERARAASIAARAEPSLEPFLPKRGDGADASARRTSRRTGRAR